jgi:hypothetical protein
MLKLFIHASSLIYSSERTEMQANNNGNVQGRHPLTELCRVANIMNLTAL